MKRHALYQGLCGVLLGLCALAAAASEISIPLSNGKQGLADFRRGSAERPAIFLLHGFLQTYRFSTIQLIADELASSGYTTLAPTLTLNINQRRQGMSCDAIQNHSVAEGNQEIADWIAWLRTQGYSRIVAIGHSSGSMRLLNYLSEQPPQERIRLIATSIGPIHDWHNPQEVQQQIQRAEELARTHPEQIASYTLGFCSHNYPAPARAYLSYMQWSEAWVLQQLQQLSRHVHVILGTNDNWLPPEWGKRLAGTSIPTTLVEGGSHNFNGAAEFELLDLILSLLQQGEADKQ